MSLEHYYRSFAEKLHNSATVRTIDGEPIEAAGRTIIPVARVAYGFGGGPATQRDDDSITEAAGGGGVSTTPLGVFDVTPAGTRFIGTGGWKKTAVGLVVGAGVGFLIGRRLRYP